MVADRLYPCADLFDDVSGPDQAVSEAAGCKVKAMARPGRAAGVRRGSFLKRFPAEVTDLVGDFIEREVGFQNGGNLSLSRFDSGGVGYEPCHGQDGFPGVFAKLDHALPNAGRHS